MGVVGRVQREGQTKESARRDKRPSPGYCVAICFYCVAVYHLFLLYGSKPYACWRQLVCHLLLLCRTKPYVSIVSVKPSAGPSVMSHTICLSVCWSRDQILYAHFGYQVGIKKLMKTNKYEILVRRGGSLVGSVPSESNSSLATV